jgi:hypothetical protein
MHLLLGAAAPSWRLPADIDIDALHDRLAAAYDDSSLARVTVEMGDNPLDTSTVVINPRQVGWWTVVDLPDR